MIRQVIMLRERMMSRLYRVRWFHYFVPGCDCTRYDAIQVFGLGYKTSWIYHSLMNNHVPWKKRSSTVMRKKHCAFDFNPQKTTLLFLIVTLKWCGEGRHVTIWAKFIIEIIHYIYIDIISTWLWEVTTKNTFCIVDDVKYVLKWMSLVLWAFSNICGMMLIHDEYWFVHFFPVDNKVVKLVKLEQHQS